MRGWDFLDRDFRSPEAVGDLGLENASLGKMGIGPDDGAVAIQFGPVALMLRGGVNWKHTCEGVGGRTFQAGVPTYASSAL